MKKSSNKNGHTRKIPKNPLFVVKNRGRDVEMINSAWKNFFTFLSPSSFLMFFGQLWSSLAGQLEGFAGLAFLQGLIAKWIEDLKILVENGRVLGKIFLGRMLPRKT